MILFVTNTSNFFEDKIVVLTDFLYCWIETRDAWILIESDIIIEIIVPVRKKVALYLRPGARLMHIYRFLFTMCFEILFLRNQF